MAEGYFQRVTAETPTRLWINNPTLAEADQAIAAGAVACTTNPTYGARLLQADPDAIGPILDRALTASEADDAVAEYVVGQITARLAERFLPLYESSGGRQGFVTIQEDPRQDESADAIIGGALSRRSIGPNFMAKIPVTAAGIRAIEALIPENIPICGTEIFALDQAIAVCELYDRVAERTGARPPFFVTHITGIFDEYLGRLVARGGISVSSQSLAWAGSTIARQEYRLIRDRGYAATVLGGGARSTRHFTDFVGGDFHITINWSTAQELIEWDPPVVSRIGVETPPAVVTELSAGILDFRRALEVGSLAIEEFAEFGPVQLFRNNFIAGYERLLAAVAECRQALASHR